jgi:type I restriction enzyme R subunit
MSARFTESEVEEAALTWFEELRYSILNGPEVAPGELFAVRGDYDEVVLAKRLRDAIEELNPNIPADVREEAVRKVLRPESPSLIQNNRAFHRMLVDGIEVEYRRPDGTIAGDRVHLLDFGNPGNNDWLVVNQFTVVENKHAVADHRRRRRSTAHPAPARGADPRRL